MEAIRAIQNGMTEEQVLAIIGPPLDRGPSSHDPEVTTLVYSKSAYFARWYPMLWIHLRDGRVIDVYGKRYIDWGVDDMGVYGTGNGPWETEWFERTFPSEAEK